MQHRVPHTQAQPVRSRRIGQISGALLAALVAMSVLVGPVRADELSTLEQALFSHDYQNESFTDRLERLEKSVFGDVQPGSVQARQAKLVNALSAARKITPKTETANPEVDADQPPPTANSFPNLQPAQPAPPKQSDATDYPTVIALERTVFSRDFIHDPIERRLERLEKKVFNQDYPNLALIDRVDKLLARYPHITAAAPGTAAEGVSPALRDLPNDSNQFLSSNRDVYTKIDTLEKALLNGRTYPNELLTERLSRLEQRTIGRTYNGESIDARLARLLRGHQVASSSQSRPPVQSRPGFQPAPSGNSYGYSGTNSPAPVVPSPSPPQNIQIGGGFSQNSTRQFSNEMLNMLPPEVRAQMSGQTSSSSGTVIGAPGTVVIEQSTTYPGFQNYGGAPLQYHNYYSVPGTGQTRTTVVQPDGSSTVYSYSNAFPSVPPGSANPTYVGDPRFLQQLGTLEANVFGRVNNMEPVYVRLGKLESALMGQMYVGYPEANRLANLQRTWQLQSIGRLLAPSTGGTRQNQGNDSVFLGIPMPGKGPKPLAPQ